MFRVSAAVGRMSRPGSCSRNESEYRGGINIVFARINITLLSSLNQLLQLFEILNCRMRFPNASRLGAYLVS